MSGSSNSRLKLRVASGDTSSTDYCDAYEDVSCDLNKLSLLEDDSTPMAAAPIPSPSRTPSPLARVHLKPRMIALSPTDNVTVNFVFSPLSGPDGSTVSINNADNQATDLTSPPGTPLIKLAPRSIIRKLTTRNLHAVADGTSSSQPAASVSHFNLSQFHWIKTIGTGTFGRVVLCQDIVAAAVPNSFAPTFYAMKILRIMDIFRLKQVEHIRDEKKILQGLDHPFIVKLLWSHHDATNLYMLLEYAAGGELFSYLRSVGRFPVPTAMFYAAEIILALEYLHARSIVYRDLKPENLIFGQDGHIKITDFGFAKELVDRTPEYLAPEIIQSRGYNKAVDYWALGILLYEMLAGHPPFFSENPIEIYQKILDAKIRWPKNFDLVAKDLIKKLLVADRTKRLGNMKNGVQDIKMHRWFRSINWTSCLNREIEPPYIPQVSHPGDASNFDDYSEEWMEESAHADNAASAEQLDIFRDF